MAEITEVDDILNVDCKALIAVSDAKLALESTYVAVECPLCHAELHTGAPAYALIPGVIANNDDCFICGGDSEQTLVVCEECGEKTAEMIKSGTSPAIDYPAMVRVLEEVQSSADNTGCEDCFVISAAAYNAVVGMLKTAKTGKELALYIVVHEHKHGLDTHMAKSDHVPSEEEVIRACSIDFEHDEDNPREFLTIDAVSMSEVPSLPAEVEKSDDEEIKCPTCGQYLELDRTDTLLGIDRNNFKCPDCRGYFIQELAVADSPITEAVVCASCHSLVSRSSAHLVDDGPISYSLGECCWDERLRD